MSTELDRAGQALELEGQVKKGLAAARVVWVALAAYLSDFHEAKLWRERGHDTFESWLADPEVDLGRSMAYALIQIYRYFIEDGTLPQKTIARYEPTKLAQVIPVLKAGEPIGAVLADVEALSRSDLREKYRGAQEPSERRFEKCDLCGHRRERQEAPEGP